MSVTEVPVSTPEIGAVEVERPAELLMEAAKIIRERGLAFGCWENDQEQVCAVAAIRIAAGGAPRYTPPRQGVTEAYERLARSLGIQSTTHCHHIQKWSDSVEDPEEVILGLERAAIGA